MKILNPNHLPQSLVNACSVKEHNEPGCISVTTLLKGCKQIVLEHRHWNDLVDTVDLRVWQIFGTAVHKLLEECNPNAFTEEKFECKVGDKTVTGQVDLYDMEEACVTDYKTASVWKITYKSFDDWRRQGLAYAWLLRHEGLEVKKCRFIAMLRDWSKGEAQRKPDYPQSQVYEYVFDVTEKDLREIEIFINDKVLQLIENEKKSDDEIAECSAEERWQSDSKWKVKKPSRKTALKVFDNEKDAMTYLDEIGGDSYVEFVPGESKRCTDYCLCNKFCNFYKEHCLKGEQE